MDIETRREVDLLEEVLEPGNAPAVKLHVVKVLAGADLLLVPGAVAEDEPMKHTVAICLGITLRARLHRGDELAGSQIIGAVETDKAVLDVPAERDGYVLKILHRMGETASVGSVLLWLGEIATEP